MTPRLWSLLCARGPELELRQRTRSGGWRATCPANNAHEITIAWNGRGLAVTCHGASGADTPGHALATHRRLREPGAIPTPEDLDLRHDLWEQAWPCRWCGCAESEVLAALGARPRDKYSQAAEEHDGGCDLCGAPAWRISAGLWCLPCLAGEVGMVGVLYRPREREPEPPRRRTPREPTEAELQPFLEEAQADQPGYSSEELREYALELWRGARSREARIRAGIRL